MRWSLLILAGCAGAEIPATPSYAADVQPVLEHHCVRCHTSEGRRDGGVELDQYASARSTRISSACTSIDPSVAEQYADALSPQADPEAAVCESWDYASMPPGAVDHLSLGEQELLARWVATGAQP